MASDYTFEYTKPAPTDSVLIESKGDGWFVTNRVEQDKLNLLLAQNEELRKAVDTQIDWLSPKVVIGSFTVCVGLGFLLGAIIFK